MHCLPHLRPRKTLYFHYPKIQSSCISFRESPSILQIAIAGFKCPLTLRAGRKEDKNLAAAKLSGSHWPVACSSYCFPSRQYSSLKIQSVTGKKVLANSVNAILSH